MSQLRQKILILYLANSALDSEVKGWTLYDGTGLAAHTTGEVYARAPLRCARA